MAEIIPEYWPDPSQEKPKTVKPIGWFGIPWAMFTILFLPTRTGRRIAYSTNTKAIFVALTSTILAVFIGLTVALLSQPEGNGIFTWSVDNGNPEIVFHNVAWREIPDVVVATCVNFLTEPEATVISGQILDFFAWIIALAFPCVLLVTIPPGPLLFMPLVAGPLSFRQRYIHCFRNLCWSSTILIPTVLAVSTVRSISTYVLYNMQPSLFDIFDHIWHVLFMAWFMVILTKLCSSFRHDRAVTELTGRRPHCTGCGYILTGISEDGNCPECGQHAHKSLPRFHTLTPWGVAGVLGKPHAYINTIRRLLTDKNFFKTLAIPQCRSEAISFAACTSALAGLSIALSCFLNYADEYLNIISKFACTLDSPGLAELLTGFLSVLLPAAILYFCLILLITQLLNRLGSRVSQNNLVVVAFSSVGLLAIPLLVSVGSTLLFVIHYFWISKYKTLQLLGFGAYWNEIVNLCYIPIIAAILFYTFRKIIKSLRDIRYTY